MCIPGPHLAYIWVFSIILVFSRLLFFAFLEVFLSGFRQFWDLVACRLWPSTSGFTSDVPEPYLSSQSHKPLVRLKAEVGYVPSSFVDLRWSISSAYTSKPWLTWIFSAIFCNWGGLAPLPPGYAPVTDNPWLAHSRDRHYPLWIIFCGDTCKTGCMMLTLNPKLLMRSGIAFEQRTGAFSKRCSAGTQGYCKLQYASSQLGTAIMKSLDRAHYELLSCTRKIVIYDCTRKTYMSVRQASIKNCKVFLSIQNALFIKNG